MKKTLIILFSAAAVLCSCSGNLKYVDSLIGTEGTGSQYGGMMPMAGVPFGSAHWVPMTRLTEVGTLSFNESDSLLLGFIGSRQPSIWMGEWGQLSFQPQTGDLVMAYESRGQQIQNTKYTPYMARVKAGGILTRYAAKEHSAVFEFSRVKHLVIDASRKTCGACSDPSEHPGEINFGRYGTEIYGWNSDNFDAHHTSAKPNFKGYFYIRLSRPIDNGGSPDNGCDSVTGYATFEKEGPLKIYVGLSLVSVEQAKENMEREVEGKSVAKVASESKKLWKKEFAKLEIKADHDIKTIFYTGLFHSLLYPRDITEYGQYYSAFDDSIHEGKMYSCWSMWDTYRAEHPLLTLIAPERVDGMMQSLLEMYKEGGWLPKWPNPSYTGIMVGSPAETILAEACTKGFKGFDIATAYEAVRKNATVPQETDHEFEWEDRGCFGDTPETRGGLDNYMKLGYVAGNETQESVSRTQDFGLQDLAAASLAKAVGKDEDAEYFRSRSMNYKNLWNSEEALFLPKDTEGNWMDPLSGHHYTECSPQTASWCIPFDVNGLCDLMGGQQHMENKLDEYFETLFFVPERGNRSIHGNEPSHHVAYLYNRIGRPWKTQMRVRSIMERSYSTDRKGFDGNEDCGQMSSWYILSSMGLYMLNPADGIYELGSPIVKEARMSLGIKGMEDSDAPYKPTELHIIAKNQSKGNIYVRKVSFNGKILGEGNKGPWQITHEELANGGILEFEMTGSPCMD